MCVVIPIILDVRLVDAPAGVAQEEGVTQDIFLIHLLSALYKIYFNFGKTIITRLEHILVLYILVYWKAVRIETLHGI